MVVSKVCSGVYRIGCNRNVKGTCFRMSSGEIITADLYVSAMPVDPLKLLIPEPWQEMTYFKNLQHFEGVPVINIHLWFDQDLTAFKFTFRLAGQPWWAAAQSPQAAPAGRRVVVNPVLYCRRCLRNLMAATQPESQSCHH